MTEKSDSSTEHVSRFDDVAERHTQDLNRNLRLAGGDSQFFYQAKLRQIRKYLTSEPSKILDFGCGVGTLARILSDAYPKAEVTGYDPSEKGIAIAAKEHAAYGPRLKFVSDLRDYPASADLVVAAGVFHHISPAQKQEAMKQATGCLRPGGRLFIFEHNPYSPLTRLVVAMAEVDRGATLVRPGRMREMMKQGGLRDLRLRFISFFPPFAGPLLKLEPYLEGVPLSAQYMVTGVKA